MIYFTSDLHFGHDRGFLYSPRGFSSIAEMNEAIINNWNSVINDDDDVYILGDLMLNDNANGLSCLNRLKGIKHIILGNHDTDTRVELYKNISSDIKYADIVKYGKYRFYLSHYPTHTSGLTNGHVSENLLNLYGHTHQKTNFYEDNPFMYHVGLDSHNCMPVSVEQVIEDIKNKVKECKELL